MTLGLRTSRRLFLKNLMLNLVIVSASRTELAYSSPMDNTINVQIKIQDEAGCPVPYVSVWSAIEFAPGHVKPHAYSQPLNLADLWRVTQRYGALHDVVSRFGDKPVNSLLVPVMGDGGGQFVHALDYQHETGQGNGYVRPSPLVFGYSFLKRGYFPGKAHFSVSRDQSHVEATVTLLRNPQEAQEERPYQRAFDQLRYELSDADRNAELTLENQQRLDGVRTSLEAAAEHAVVQGDKAAAARIYSRMRFLPSVTRMGGKIVGFSQGNAASTEAKLALDKAYALDPDNLYVWMHTYLRRVPLASEPTQQQKIVAALNKLEKLITSQGEAVWPFCHERQAKAYVLLGDYEKARQLYLNAKKLEPRYADWSAQIEAMKTDMKRLGHAIPAGW